MKVYGRPIPYTSCLDVSLNTKDLLITAVALLAIAAFIVGALNFSGKLPLGGVDGKLLMSLGVVVLSIDMILMGVKKAHHKKDVNLMTEAPEPIGQDIVGQPKCFTSPTSGYRFLVVPIKITALNDSQSLSIQSIQHLQNRDYVDIVHSRMMKNFSKPSDGAPEPTIQEIQNNGLRYLVLEVTIGNNNPIFLHFESSYELSVTEEQFMQFTGLKNNQFKITEHPSQDLKEKWYTIHYLVDHKPYELTFMKGSNLYEKYQVIEDQNL